MVGEELMEVIRIPYKNETKSIPLFSSGRELLLYLLSSLCEDEKVSATTLIEALEKKDNAEELDVKFGRRLRELLESAVLLTEFMSEQIDRSLCGDKKLFLNEDVWTECCKQSLKFKDTLNFIRQKIQDAGKDATFIKMVRLLCSILFLEERKSFFFGKTGSTNDQKDLQTLELIMNMFVYMYNITAQEALCDYIVQTDAERIPVDGVMMSYGEILSNLCVYRYIKAINIPDNANISDEFTKNLKQAMSEQYARQDLLIHALQDQGITLEQIYTAGKSEIDRAQEATDISLPEMFKYGPYELSLVLPEPEYLDEEPERLLDR